jgi:hypothetical protein
VKLRSAGFAFSRSGDPRLLTSLVVADTESKCATAAVSREPSQEIATMRVRAVIRQEVVYCLAQLGLVHREHLRQRCELLGKTTTNNGLVGLPRA